MMERCKYEKEDGEGLRILGMLHDDWITQG